jgi:hypothetical protein
MSLKGAFAKVQKAGAQFYLKLAEFFEENPLIRDSWVAMAQDMEQQAASLEELPRRFWSGFKKDEEALQIAVRNCLSLEAIDKKADRSLHACYIRTLNLAEPLILSAYVPLIRLLRTECFDHGLDFYVMVKSHVTRITRIIQPFSVDPLLLQRVQGLALRFELEVQAPVIPAALPKKKLSQKKKAHALRRAAARRLRKMIAAARAAKRPLPLRKRVPALTKRAKPLVAKLDIARRRARR